MPRPHISMRKIRDLLRLSFGEGLSTRQTAASLQMPHTTVCEHLKRARAAGVGWPLPEGLDDDGLEALLFPRGPASPASRPMPDWRKIHLELKRPHVTLMLLWLEHKEAFPEAHGYSQFCEHYRAWRRGVDLVMRQEHKAGERLFVDFPGRRIPIYDETTGEILFEAELFVAVLGASGYLYAEALRSQELLYWVTAHVHNFEALGGVPEICVCDNLRAGVTRPHRYEPDVNATYQDMAAHYNVAIIPARSYKPRDKAKAEGAVLLAERFIIAALRNQRFTSLAELNAEIARLVTWINERPFKKINGSRKSLFEALDRPALRPLPATRYEFATFRRAKVGLDYHLEIRADRHYYSVPYGLVGEKVDLRLSASTVEVFFRNRRVASHVRVHRPGFTTDPAHMPDAHRRHGSWTPARIVSFADKTGPATAKLVAEVMAARRHPEQGFRSCLGIVRLADRYGSDRLEAAASRALALCSYSYRSVESILKNNLDNVPLPVEEAEQLTLPVHDNVRGADYYQ